MNIDISKAWLQQTINQFNDGCFPATIGPQKANNTARLDVQTNIHESNFMPIILCHMVQVDQRILIHVNLLYFLFMLLYPVPLMIATLSENLLRICKYLFKKIGINKSEVRETPTSDLF